MPRTIRRPLGRAVVLDGAVRLADGEGLQAVTMRRLAATLGVEAMSLYHHVSGKEPLLDGLVEQLLAEIRAEIDALDPTDAWREDLRGRCLAARRVMLRHPWGPALITSRPSVPAAAYVHFEEVLATLVNGGCSYHLAHRALHALGGMVLGFAQELFAPASASGGVDEVATAAAEAQLAEMAAALPHLAAMVEAELHAAGDPVLGWCDSQAEFEFTLDLLLDGLERLSRAT